MAFEPFAIGSHILLVPYNSGVSDTSTKPSAGSFAEIGVVTASEWTPTYMDSEVVGPAPGGKRRLFVVPHGQTIEFSFTLETVGRLFWQLLFGTNALAAGSTELFNPFERGAPWQGWVKCQQYDGAHTLRAVHDLYAALTVDAVPMGGDTHVTATVRGRVIDSSLNVSYLYVLAD